MWQAVVITSQLYAAVRLAWWVSPWVARIPFIRVVGLDRTLWGAIWRGVQKG